MRYQIQVRFSDAAACLVKKSDRHDIIRRALIEAKRVALNANELSVFTIPEHPSLRAVLNSNERTILIMTEKEARERKLLQNQPQSGRGESSSAAASAAPMTMQFCEHPTFYDSFKRDRIYDAHRLDTQTWLNEVAYKWRNPVERLQLVMEARWMLEHRPYYSVYPAIAAALARVRLDVDCSLVQLPLPRLLVRFSAKHPYAVANHQLQSFLVFEAYAGTTRGLGLLINFGQQRHRRIQLEHGVFPLLPGTTIEEQLRPERVAGADRLIDGIPSMTLIEPCVRMVVAICLMQNDPEIICPDVLATDAEKFWETGDQKYVDRAHRHKKRGWLVGAKIEISPHFRNWHMALRWAGKGRTEPRIVKIDGTWVHRRKVTDVPTGYLDYDEQRAGDEFTSG